MTGSPAFLADPALRAVLAALPDSRLVGGCVRDWLADVAVADIDLATPQPPRVVIQALEAAGLRAVPTGIAHGTVTAVSGGHGFEVTTLRRDIETDGRHATVAFTDNWREDAARRDFTFNAMSMTPAGEIFDYFGGIDDLRAGRVRFVGDPATRLAEDHLRTLRFFRFYARYAAALPEPAVLAALRAAAPGLIRLSAERIWAELKRILAVPASLHALTLMQDLGILPAVLPEAGAPDRLAALIDVGAPADPLLRLAALLPPDAASPAARLRLSAAESARLNAIRTAPTPTAADSDDDLRRHLANTSADSLIARTWLTGGPDSLRERIAGISAPVFLLEGRDAMALDIAPGPAIGAVLATTRARWLADGCTADRATCLGWLKAAAADYRNRPLP